MVAFIKDLDEFKTTAKAPGKKAVVDFTASWCGPCQKIAPEYSELAKKYETDNITCYKVDVDENQDAAEDADVEAMPTFIFYHNGEIVKKVTGADIEQIKQAFEELKSHN